MRTLFSNRYVDALAKTIFFFGLFHLSILGYIAIQEGFQVLNAFNILNLDLFIPSLGRGAINWWLSYLMVLVVYCLVYLRLTKHSNADDGSDRYSMANKFYARPKDTSLQAYKDWINGIAKRFNPAAKDDMTEEQWVERWKKFWSKAERDGDNSRVAGSEK